MRAHIASHIATSQHSHCKERFINKSPFECTFSPARPLIHAMLKAALAFPEAMPHSLRLTLLVPLMALPWILMPTTQAQEPPSKAFVQRNVPLSLIFSEWRQKGNNANTYICACDREICDTRPGWPFRSFQTGESIPALGETNMNDARRIGFICGRR